MKSATLGSSSTSKMFMCLAVKVDGGNVFGMLRGGVNLRAYE